MNVDFKMLQALVPVLPAWALIAVVAIWKGPAWIGAIARWREIELKAKRKLLEEQRKLIAATEARDARKLAKLADSGGGKKRDKAPTSGKSDGKGKRKDGLTR